MATGTRQVLSESAGLIGGPIAIVASGTDGSEVTGTLLHTATNVVDERDEVFLYVSNETAQSGTVTVQIGGTTPNQHDTGAQGVESRQGWVQVLPGFTVASGAEIRAYGDFDMVTVTGLRATGWVNRISN